MTSCGTVTKSSPSLALSNFKATRIVIHDNQPAAAFVAAAWSVVIVTRRSTNLRRSEDHFSRHRARGNHVKALAD